MCVFFPCVLERMINYDLVEDALLEHDGSLREITFTPVHLSNLIRFLDHVLNSHQIVKAYNVHGESVLLQLAARKYDLLSNKKGLIHVIWESNNHVLSWLQGFINWPSRKKNYELELSFSPDDLRNTDFEVQEFISAVEDMKNVLNCHNYYVRYESASWDVYNPTSSGVIYTGKDIAEAAF